MKISNWEIRNEKGEIRNTHDEIHAGKWEMGKEKKLEEMRNEVREEMRNKKYEKWNAKWGMRWETRRNEKIEEMQNQTWNSEMRN